MNDSPRTGALARPGHPWTQPRFDGWEAKLKELGRALSDDDKEEIMARLLAAWKAVPEQRLGQLLGNALGQERPHQQLRERLLLIEDQVLTRVVERFANERRAP